MVKSLAPFLFVAILVFGGIAGCLDSQANALKGKGANKIQGVPPKVWSIADPILSQPIFKELIFEHFPVMASDGIKLDNWVWRPKTPDDVKIPTIIHLSPYFANSLPNGNFDKWLKDNFTHRGYAVMAASVRGTGFSEGCFEIGGPRERQDYNELFNEIAKQPWSNGLVGLIGVSYDGTAPQGALIAGSPHLKTIVPVAAISEWYKYNFVKGVQINPQGWAFNTYYVALEQVPVNLHGFVPPNPSAQNPLGVLAWRPPGQGDVAKWPGDIVTYGSRVCPSQGGGSGNFRGPSLVDVQRAQIVTAPTGTTDPYWEERNFTRYLDKVRDNVSVFVVHGLIDYNVKTHNLMPWIPDLQKHGIPTKIMLGQWPHSSPWSFNNLNSRLDWNTTLLRWFDYWLKDIETGIMDEPMADIQDYLGVWRTEDNFPPTRAEATKFFFGSDGALKPEAGATGTRTFIDNGQGPQMAGSMVPGGPPNFVSFLGPKLDQEFRYSGEAVAHLDLRHSSPIGHVAVTVYNVTGQTWKPVNWGFYNYNIRNTPEKFDPILPADRIVLNVPLLPTDMVIPKGSQVAVVVSALNSGGPGMLPVHSGGQTTVDLATSYITFPMLDGITPMNPQPLNLRGQPSTRSSAGN